MTDVLDPEEAAMVEAMAIEGKIKEFRVAMQSHMRVQTQTVQKALQKSDETKKDKVEIFESMKAMEQDYKKEATALRDDLQRLERELQRMSDELAEERKAHPASQTDSIWARLDVLADTIEEHRWDALSQLKEVEPLRKEFNIFREAMEDLRDNFDRDASTRKFDEEVVTSQLRELDRDFRIHESAFQDTLSALKGAMEQDKQNLDLTFQQCRAEVGEIRGQFAQELQRMRTKLKEADEFLPKVRDHQRSIEKLFREQESSKTTFENRIAEICGEIKAESDSRIAREEELDQALLTSKAKMHEVLTKQADGSRLASEALRVDLQSELEKKIASGEAQVTNLEEKLLGQRLQLEVRVDSLQKSLATLERRLTQDGARGHSGHTDPSGGRRQEELGKQIRDAKEAFIKNLSEERATREVAVRELEEKVVFLHGFFHDVGRKFGSRGPSRGPTPSGARVITPVPSRTDLLPDRHGP